MLAMLTSATDFVGMSVALWLGIYLLGRGFSSPITQRAVVILVVLALSFFISYLNLYQTVPNVGAWWAALLTVGLIAWYDVTYQLLSPSIQTRLRWVMWAVYSLGLLKIALLIVFRDRFSSALGSTVWIIAGKATPLSIADGIFISLTAVAVVYNFRASAQSGIGPHSRSTWLATLLGALAIGYGTLALIVKAPVARWIQDAMLVAAILALGHAVATHQTLVERRTTMRDLPISGLAMIGLSVVYALIAVQQNVAPPAIAVITLLAILTHSAYDMVRAFLDRLLHQKDAELRQQFRSLARDVSGPGSLEPRLQQGLDSLCHALGALGGFIAVRQEDKFIVSASLHSLAPGTALAPAEVACDDLSVPGASLAATVAWLAPVAVNNEQKAVIAVGPRRNREQYSEADLDLLAEVADWAGMLVSTYSQQGQSREQLMQLAEEIQARELGLRAATDQFIAAMQSQPDPEFIRHVEAALRSLTDFTALAQSPLVAKLGIVPTPHIESGKSLREQLIRAIETLRPAGPRPTGVLPREWHCYAVLHDAYVEDVPNRDIMARLYISEGTFNRLRRKALSTVARALLELSGSAAR